MAVKKPQEFYDGLEFYKHPGMGLCGSQMENGTAHTYQYLADWEAATWLRCWLAGERFVRGAERAKLSS